MDYKLLLGVTHGSKVGSAISVNLSVQNLFAINLKQFTSDCKQQIKHNTTVTWQKGVNKQKHQDKSKL